MNIPTQQIDRPIVFPIVLVLFLVPAIIIGRMADDKPPLVGALGAIFTYILIFFILPLVLPLLPSVNERFDTLAVVFLLLVLFVGAIGGRVGGTLRDRSVYQSSPMLPTFLTTVIVGVLLSFLSVIVLLVLFAPASSSPRTQPPKTESAPVIESSHQSTLAAVATAHVTAPIPTASPRLTTASSLPTGISAPTPFTVTPMLASPTVRPVAVQPSATKPPLAPGVYVTILRLEPANPRNVDSVRFFVGFQNTAGPLKFKWCVYIFKVGQSNPIGQTSCDAWIDFPLGSYEYVTPNTWRLGTGQPCTDFFAQVQGIETDGKRLIFKTPNGNENGTFFQVCP
jgi:hypothetical protein